MSRTSTVTLMLLVALLTSSTQVSALKRCENGKLMKIPDFKTLCVPIDAEQGECQIGNNTQLKMCELMNQKHNLNVCLQPEHCTQNSIGASCDFDTDCSSLKCSNNTCAKRTQQRQLIGGRGSSSISSSRSSYSYSSSYRYSPTYSYSSSVLVVGGYGYYGYGYYGYGYYGGYYGYSGYVSVGGVSSGIIAAAIIVPLVCIISCIVICCIVRNRRLRQDQSDQRNHSGEIIENHIEIHHHDDYGIQQNRIEEVTGLDGMHAYNQNAYAGGIANQQVFAPSNVPYAQHAGVINQQQVPGGYYPQQYAQPVIYMPNGQLPPNQIQRLDDQPFTDTLPYHQ